MVQGSRFRVEDWVESTSLRRGDDLVVTVEVDARVGGVVELGVEPLERLKRQLRDRPETFSQL